MATKTKGRVATKGAAGAKRAYRDLHEHLAALDEAGLLCRIDAPVNKDTELHPLVRWQFRGGIPEEARKAFLFTNVTDSLGRTYDMPVVVGALSTNARMYSSGSACRSRRSARSGTTPSPIPSRRSRSRMRPATRW